MSSLNHKNSALAQFGVMKLIQNLNESISKSIAYEHIPSLPLRSQRLVETASKHVVGWLIECGAQNRFLLQ
jgi:hypothetical protein